MRSRETLSLFKSAQEIRVAIDADGERIGGLLNETRPLPVPEGDPIFDYRQHLRHLGHQLDQAVADTSAAEDLHAAQLIRVARFQSERNDAFKGGYDTLVSTRQGLESLYPSGAFELGFLSGRTPDVPDKLLAQLQQTVKLLREPAVDLRGVKVRGFGVDLGEVVTELESEIVSVEGALDRLAMARKATEGTLVLKRKAIDEMRRTLLWAGRTTEGLFHLAGESELAERVRKSTRRSVRPATPPSDEDGGEDGPGVPGSGQPGSGQPGSGQPGSGQPGDDPATEAPAPSAASTS